MLWGEDFFVACALIAITIFLVVNILKLACGLRHNCCNQNEESELVRQAPVYTIASDPRGNDTTSNFTDYFWNVSSQNTRANEPTKDDKDLPSYEEVLRMEMARQVIDSAVQAPITTTTIHTTETSQPPPALAPPVRLPV